MYNKYKYKYNGAKLKKILLILIISLFSGSIYALPIKENISVEKGGAFLRIQLGSPHHPVYGQEIGYSSSVMFESEHIFFLRHYGFTRYSVKEQKAVYFPVPRKFTTGRNLFSLYVSKRGVWIGSADGYLLYYGRKKKKWRKYSLKKGFKVIVSRIHHSLTVFSFKIGSKVSLLDEKTRRFFKLFQFPKEIPARPIKTIRLGSDYWSGTTQGLFRFNKAYPNYSWQMCGARDGLSKTLVTDLIPVGKYLLLSSVKNQSIYFAANQKYTSYGKFVYNYLQKKWQRENQADKEFLKLNSSNRSLPLGGIWLYNTKTDRAKRFVGLDSDIFHLAKLNKTRYLAAGRDGLYLLQFKNNVIKLMRLALSRMNLVKAVLVSKKNVGFMIGGSFYLSGKKAWEKRVIHSQIYRTATGMSRHGVTAGSTSKKFASDKQSVYNVNDDSEENRFIKQVEAYINRVKK